MIKNNITILLVQTALSIICLTVNLMIGVSMGDRPESETVSSWLNLVVYVLVFFWIGYTKLNQQSHWLKNAGSVLFTTVVSFLLLFVLGDNLYNMGHIFGLISLVFIIPVKWAWDFKNYSIGVRSLFILIPAFSSFIGLYSRLHKKTSLK
ncbi:hypothetical protein ACFVRR_23345 [Gottfriedia sp. NPDC057948]|uniref:hypothetical protein n=1 Tax=Gottfriedia sp. NPDC057948 TaxID=3346287 RepID=UPI0036DA4BF8